MEDIETPRMNKYGERKTTRIMVATVPHVTAWAGRTKYQAAWFLLNRVWSAYCLIFSSAWQLSWKLYRMRSLHQPGN